MAIDKPDYVVTMESGPVTTAAIAAIQASVNALPPRIDYQLLADAERGRDDTEVLGSQIAYTLRKTVAMTFLTADKDVKKVAINMRTTNAAITATVQLRISVDGGAEVTIETWTTRSTSYVLKSKTFDSTYGTLVEARLYMKTENALWEYYEKFTRLHGDERRRYIYV